MRSWLGFLNQERPPTWVRASLPSEIWSWESSSEPRTRCWERSGCWGQGRETCYPSGVVDSSSSIPASLVDQPRSSWETHEEAELCVRSRRDLMNRCGADQLLEGLGREEKHLDMEVSFRKLATHLATPIQFGTLLFPPRYYQITHGLRSHKVQVKFPYAIWF